MKYGKCDDCYFYVESSSPMLDGGVCKRYPPKSTDPFEPNPLPFTSSDSFCGEFHPYPEEISE